ncbi:shikimate dehydrogenase [Dethiobacter alkaliphilus]|uniref:Shikimate dehydrogenase (NADP(+)) n=1 Tax=Dethiobacter alkaliphilus AHT 1 TaxID=555088 RepID=C0GEF1_DETAL|nr:shikimate dehydrogenase [Dethiobacter alkaliphilus]EEG78445.1 shikimate 5-dehydrogenase [Dethiobacter alkaliphilus AHT 1]
MKISGRTKITGIFGDPVEHSLSPAMHNAAFAHLDLDYVYVPFHVNTDDIKRAVGSIKALNITGVNVTVPHKQDVIPFLDEIDKTASRCSAVNTIVNKDGILTGYNTDGTGFIDSLKEYGFNPKDKEVVIIGAGGSARAICAALLENKVSQITIINRSLENAEQLAESLGQAHTFSVIPLISNYSPSIYSADLVVNTLSIPFKQEDGDWLVDLSSAAGALFYDLRYGKMPSDFLTYAKELKSPGLDGLGMLLHQGARAFELFTGTKAPTDIMKKATST